MMMWMWQLHQEVAPLPGGWMRASPLLNICFYFHSVTFAQIFFRKIIIYRQGNRVVNLNNNHSSNSFEWFFSIILYGKISGLTTGQLWAAVGGRGGRLMTRVMEKISLHTISISLLTPFLLPHYFNCPFLGKTGSELGPRQHQVLGIKKPYIITFPNRVT